MSLQSASSALTPDPALVERFRFDLARLCDPVRDRVLLAVSGGADSMALLLLGHATLGERCVAATVDHGLRAQSRAEARLVATACRARGVEHAILTDTIPERVGRTTNLSARARAMRYRLLEGHAALVGARYVATAHHADDQLETVVMRLNRGAGVSGLAGIRERGGPIIRPVLRWRRAELAALVSACGVAAVEDPTNRDDRFDRARLRKVLAGADWLDAERAGASARALADADAALDWMTDRLAKQFCSPRDDGVALWPGNIPFEFKRRLVHHCLARLDPALEVSGPALVRLVEALEANKGSTLGGVVARIGRNEQGGIIWVFRPAPPRRVT